MVVVVNPVVWNGINLRMFRGQLLVEGVHCRMRFRMLHLTLAKPDVQFPGVCVAQSLVRIPNSKVVAHGALEWPNR